MNGFGRRDVLLMLGGFVMVTAVFVVLVFLPGRRSHFQIRADIAAAEQEIARIPERVNELERLYREIKERRSYLKQHERVLLANVNLHELLRDVASLADGARLSVRRVEPLPDRPFETYRSQPFRITFTGRFSDIVRFMNGLEEMGRLVVVEEFRVNSSDKVESGVLEGDIRFVVYARRTASAGSDDFSKGPA